jgi:hypothetical protein
MGVVSGRHESPGSPQESSSKVFSICYLNHVVIQFDVGTGIGWWEASEPRWGTQKARIKGTSLHAMRSLLEEVLPLLTAG